MNESVFWVQGFGYHYTRWRFYHFIFVCYIHTLGALGIKEHYKFFLKISKYLFCEEWHIKTWKLFNSKIKKIFREWVSFYRKLPYIKVTTCLCMCLKLKISITTPRILLFVQNNCASMQSFYSLGLLHK